MSDKERRDVLIAGLMVVATFLCVVIAGMTLRESQRRRTATAVALAEAEKTVAAMKAQTYKANTDARIAEAHWRILSPDAKDEVCVRLGLPRECAIWPREEGR